MHEIAFDLLILLTGVWLVAVTLRPLGLPTGDGRADRGRASRSGGAGMDPAG